MLSGGSRPQASRIGKGLLRALGPWFLAWLAWHRGHQRLPFLFLALGVVVVALWWAFPAAAERVEHAVTHRIGSAVGFVLFGVIEIVVILPVFAVLSVTGRAGGRAEPSPVDETRWARPFIREPRPPRRPHRKRRRAVLAIVGLIALLGATFAITQRGSGGSARRPMAFPGFAFRDAPWIGELGRTSGAVIYDPVLGWRNADTDFPNIHVQHDERTSYEPAQPTATVWFFGGSTMYGIGQRDQHTIPSEVARLAERDGIRLRVVNLGVPAYTNWQEVQLFSLLLVNRKAPDVAVFYDGANDLPLVRGRADTRHAVDQPGNHYEDDLRVKTGFRPEPTQPVKATQAQSIAGLAHVYGGGVDLARRLATSFGIRPVFYWQPAAWSLKQPFDWRIWTATGGRPGDERVLRGLSDGIRRRLPPGIVDLSTALDDQNQPTYFDPVHTNERGALLVAEAIWRDLKPRVIAAPQH